MEILNDKVVKTRKEHQCFACLRPFPSGSTMRNQVNVFDGEINSLHWCMTCDELFKKYMGRLYDDDENMYPGACVSDLLNESEFEGHTPETLLKAKI